MKAVVTGASGTVGSVLVKYLESKGIGVVPWDRKVVPVNNYNAMEDFILSSQADFIFHLAIASQPTGMDNEFWKINFEWPSELAWICRMHALKFVFTSTVMVFTDDAKGPFTMESVPDAFEGYGYAKKLAEERVLAQNPASLIVRLGWQIGESAGSNNMIDYLENEMKTKGKIEASEKWLPACIYLEDTAAALHSLAINNQSGIYMADANAKWNFYQIASALNAHHGNKWVIEKTDSFVYDQRMIDNRITVNKLSAHLPELGI